MDFINAEKKLIQAQINVFTTMKHDEMLGKLNSTIEVLNTQLPEHIPATMKTEELLSIDKKLELPLMVRGDLLGVGKHKRRYYTADELKRSVEAHGNKTIPIRLDHKKPEVSFIIGAIDKIFWDDMRKVVMYEGHINDETHARNILDRVTSAVSAGMASFEEFDPMFGIVAKDIDYTELSIVHEGSFKGNSIEAVL